MRIITMDEEGRDLLHAAAEMAHAALDARARRVDPEGLVSRSTNMSRIKTRDLLNQLDRPPLPKFSELPDATRQTLYQAMELLREAETYEKADAALDYLRTIVLDRLETNSPIRQIGKPQSANI